MKRSFFVVGLVLALMLSLSVGVAPVQAQFTLLPSAGSCNQEDPKARAECEAALEAECKMMLDQFELDTTILSDFDVKSSEADDLQEKADQAANNYDAIKEATKAPCAIGSTIDECTEFNKAKEEADKAQEAADEATVESFDASDVPRRDKLLGCAIRTGRVSLQMIPYFITYMANFLLAMSGIVSVLFIVVGGYFYIYGGLVDQKERGKKYLVNALVGLSLAIVSWSLVTFIINAITS